MPEAALAFRNLGLRAWRRIRAAHKPMVRLARRRAREGERREALREVANLERELERIATAGRPIVAGPWLAEVGYEVLYWVPFLRWFQDAYRIPRDRLIVLSRGGVHQWYEDFAATYVEMFDLMAPGEVSARNERRQVAAEGGGRKQTVMSALDAELVRRTAAACGGDAPVTCHPSLMFRLFRHVWHGTQPFDDLWTRTRFRAGAGSLTLPPDLPDEFTAVKFYSGTALPATEQTHARLRELVARAARVRTVILLDSGVTVDEHSDFGFAGVPNVLSAARWMRPATNLGVQTVLAAHARLFLGTCGGLAWLAPFLGTPTVAAYADDRQLVTHLYVARHATRITGAAEFLPLDVRAIDRIAL